MIPIIIDTNIVYSAIYNEKGLERKLINIAIESDAIQLFAPTTFFEEIRRNLSKKLGFQKNTIDSFLAQFDIIEITFEEYKPKIAEAKRLIPHENDIPFVACALLLNSPVWSGNETHFNALKGSKKVIWFNSKRLLDYFRSKGLENRK
jgi:predicted nucleic acid-binding protein